MQVRLMTMQSGLSGNSGLQKKKQSDTSFGMLKMNTSMEEIAAAAKQQSKIAGVLEEEFKTTMKGMSEVIESISKKFKKDPDRNVSVSLNGDMVEFAIKPEKGVIVKSPYYQGATFSTDALSDGKNAQKGLNVYSERMSNYIDSEAKITESVNTPSV